MTRGLSAALLDLQRRSVLSKIICHCPGREHPTGCYASDTDLSGETDSEAGDEKSLCSAAPATPGIGARGHEGESEGGSWRSATPEAGKGTGVEDGVVVSVTQVTPVSSMEATGDPVGESGARPVQDPVQEAVAVREAAMMASGEVKAGIGGTTGGCSQVLKEPRARDAGPGVFDVSTKPPPDGCRHGEPLTRGSSFVGPSGMVLAASDDMLLRELLLDGIVEDSVVSEMAV